VAGAEEIELPVASVVAGLPMDLRAKLVSAPPAGLTLRLQAEIIIGQLAFGAVKISFGELRRLVPGVFVNSGGELDNKLVSLPLQEILPRLNPALLARRSGKKIEVADEIVGPFAERGRGFTFTTQPLKGMPVKAPAPAPTPAPAPSAPISFTTPPPAPPAPPAPAAPRTPPPAAARQTSPPTPSFTPRSITPAPSGGSGISHAAIPPVPISPLSPRPPTPAAGFANGANGANGHGGTNGNGHSNGSSLPLPPGLRLGSMNGNNRMDIPPLKMSPQSAEPAAAPAAPAMPSGSAICVRLGDLCEHWPSELKDQILQSPLGQAKVALENSVIMPGLKRGRVVMTWKQIRQLAQPDSSPSPKDNVELELPLKVIAPLFLAAQKAPARPASKMAVSEEIPDLFFGFPQPAAAPVAPVSPVAPVPPLSKPAEAKQQDTNYFARADKPDTLTVEEPQTLRSPVPQTDFLNRQAHPKDVVARAAAQAGVAGALVAMQDGLRVASQVPAEFNADTLAAFLPQIFERVNQSTRELRMGALNNINFTVGNVPWKIFRVNSVYFAAFGRTGESLPSGQLAQLAAELDRKPIQ
jgi:predicted regulator of Ras-like GTPase activity (Roadblock/LC7/MglB family)